MAENKACAQLLKEAGLSVTKAYELTLLSRVSFYRQRIDWHNKKDRIVIDTIQSVLAKSPQSGF